MDLFLRRTRVSNFWVDMVRSTVYILAPLAILLTVLLVSQGVIQNLDSYKSVAGAKTLLPMGLAASQIAIKQLGTNGGGFFNVNSAHPYENPTPLSNFAEMLACVCSQCRIGDETGGHVIVSTFGPEGPTKCSGLDVMR